MNEGWIILHRRILHNPFWKIKPFSKGQAWIDLILLANYSKGFIYVRGNKVTVERGQVGWSQKRLSERWGWSRTKVRNFLKDLEEEQQIEQQKNSLTTIITLKNYDKYQPEKREKNNRRTAEKQQKNSRETLINNNNKENKNKNNSSNGTPYEIDDSERWDEDQPINYQSFVEKFNLMYDRELRVTAKKRENIRSRLRTFTGKEILTAWLNRKDDTWLSGEGIEYLGDWKAAMRNDEKIDKYLNKDQSYAKEDSRHNETGSGHKYTQNDLAGFEN